MERPRPFTILVIDDEPPICDLLTRISRTLFPEATFVDTRSAQETIDYLANHPTQWPQLVLLDVDLHQAIDGLDFLPQLRQLVEGRVPIIMLTTTVDKPVVEKAYEAGAAAFTQKPEDLQGWRDYVANLRTYWYKNARLPPL